MINQSPPECPYYLISRSTLAVTTELKKGFSQGGVHHVRPAYLGVLFVLWDEDSLKANELGKRAGLEPSTMTGLLDRMERDGILKRTPDPNDRRANRIKLTQKGKDEQAPAMQVVMDVLDQVFKDISEQDLETTKTVLRKVLINCNKEIFYGP
ncbi:MAG: MarR family transcriptional regulator [Desulfobacteraceae bacterium]|nr:MarR family transcriptional regulator [Desulfobacteraceae bacterium]